MYIHLKVRRKKHQKSITLLHQANAKRTIILLTKPQSLSRSWVAAQLVANKQGSQRPLTAATASFA